MARSTKRPKPAEVGPVRLTVVRGPRTDGRWYWRARRKSERDTVWTGWATRDEAMAAVAQEVARGRLPSSPSAAIEAPRTVGELLSAYLGARKAQIWCGDLREKPQARGVIAQATYDKYMFSARHLVCWLGDVLLARLDAVLLATYVVNRRHHDERPALSDRTVHGELNLLNIAWRWARDRGWVTGVLPAVLHPDQERYVYNRRTPTAVEVRSVLPHLPGDTRLAVELWAWTGARLSEITKKLLLRDIDLETDQLTLYGKRGKTRLVPIHPDHRELMANRKRAGAPDDPLLSAPQEQLARRNGGDTTMSAGTLRYQLARACEAAGVPCFTPHGLRRFVDDLLYDANIDPGTTSQILGQSPEVALRSYRTVRSGRKRQAMISAGLGAVLRREEDNVIRLPGADVGEETPALDLSQVPLAALHAELHRRECAQADDGLPERARAAAGEPD